MARELARRIPLRAAVVALVFAALASPGPVDAQAPPQIEEALSCPVNAPASDPNAASNLQALTARINAVWPQAAATSIDPLSFGTGDVTGACRSDSGTDCFFGTGLPTCLHSTGRFDISQLTGLSQLGFSNLTASAYSPKDVALHSEPGPEAGKITDGVFAPEGADWNHPSYTVIPPLAGSGWALTIDLGEVMNICGSSAGCAPKVQADRHPFQLEYSSDGTSWTKYAQVPGVSADGLRTRTVVANDFSARYVRIYGLPASDTNYSVSEVQLKDPSGRIVSTGKRAIGPRPYLITDGAAAKEGTAWNDKNWAVVLRKDGPGNALVVDLGAPVTICGGACNTAATTGTCDPSDKTNQGPSIQADKNEYQVDYSLDGVNWTRYSTLPAVSGTGLRTRCLAPVAPGTASKKNPSFTARYVRIWGLSGDGNYSVSELALFNPSGAKVSLGAVTYGPEAVVTDGEVAPEGADWNDPRYARILSPCSSGSTCAGGSQPSKTGALVIDLNGSFAIGSLVVQADRHQFQVDYWDSASGTWKALATVPELASSFTGLRTRPPQTFSPPPVTSLLLVYGTKGDDSNYSISSVQVFTAKANTPCASASGADAGQDFSCSYDGRFTTQVQLPTPGRLGISFTIDKAEGYLRCTNGTTEGSTPTKPLFPAKTQCTATLTAPQAANGAFCSGTCASAPTSSVLSSVQLDPVDTSQPITWIEISDVACDSGGLMSGATDELTRVIEAAVAAAVQEVFNGVLVQAKLVPTGICQAPPTASGPDTAVGVQGSASNIGSGRDNGSVSLTGRFTVGEPIALNQANLVLGAVLAHAGSRELVRGAETAEFLPLLLAPRAGSTAAAAIYETPSGTRPTVRVEVKTRDAKTGLMEFSLRVDRATIPAPPPSCAGGAPLAELATSFALHVRGASAAEPPVIVHMSPDWRCLGSALRTP